MMRPNGLLYRLGGVSPQVPAVGNLHGLGSAGPGSLGVGTGPVPADDLHLRMHDQPGGEGLGFPPCQHLDRSMGLQVDEDGGI